MGITIGLLFFNMYKEKDKLSAFFIALIMELVLSKLVGEYACLTS